jgi:hypothetical protein
MKNIFLSTLICFSITAWAAGEEPMPTPANPSNPGPTTEAPTGTIVPPTKKQLKSIKKPKKKKTSTEETH